MSARYKPQLDDFFPKTMRGHGTAHSPIPAKEGGGWPDGAPRCVNTACKGEHSDKGANVTDWKTERGFRKQVPLDQCR